MHLLFLISSLTVCVKKILVLDGAVSASSHTKEERKVPQKLWEKEHGGPCMCWEGP